MSAADRGGPALAMARGLGWFSIGIGVAELLAPRTMARAAGLGVGTPLVAGNGLREIATGIGILASKDPTPWIWGRVGGDVLDLTTIGAGLAAPGADERRGLAGLLAVGAITALDVLCVRALGAERQRSRRPMRDYSDRSGWTKPIEQVRGAARGFPAPKDMRIPEPLRPYPA